MFLITASFLKITFFKKVLEKNKNQKKTFKALFIVEALDNFHTIFKALIKATDKEKQLTPCVQIVICGKLFEIVQRYTYFLGGQCLKTFQHKVFEYDAEKSCACNMLPEPDPLNPNEFTNLIIIVLIA